MLVAEEQVRKLVGAIQGNVFSRYELMNVGQEVKQLLGDNGFACLLYTSPSPRDGLLSRMPSSA